MNLLHTADPHVWDPTIGARIAHELAHGFMVAVRTVSGTKLQMLTKNGRTFAVRHNPYFPLHVDGLPMPATAFEATSCGLWIPGMYRGSRPVVIASFAEEQTDQALTHASKTWLATLRDLDDRDPGWLARVPAGHPAQPCPVHHCALRIAEA